MPRADSQKGKGRVRPFAAPDMPKTQNARHDSTQNLEMARHG